MAERKSNSLLISLQELKQIQDDRVTQERAAVQAKADAEQQALDTEIRRKREELEAQERAEQERLRLEKERQEAAEREVRIKREAEERKAAVIAEEARRRDTVAAEAAAAAKAKTARLRNLVILSVVASILVLSGIGYLVNHFYKTKQRAQEAVAQNDARAKELEAQIASLNKDLQEDMRRNAGVIDKLNAQLDAAPGQARQELAARLRQAEQRKRRMEQQQERTRRRFESRKRRGGITDRL